MASSVAASAGVASQAEACQGIPPTITTVSLDPDNFGHVIARDVMQSAPLEPPLPNVVAAPPPNPELVAAKSKLRASMGATLSGLSEHTVALSSSELLSRATKLEAYHSAQAIAIFVSMPAGEVQTVDIIRHSLSLGKKVFVPRVETLAARKKAEQGGPASAPAVAVAPTGGRMRLLQVRSMQDMESWQPNRWGIREPPLTETLDGSQQLRLEGHDCPELDLIFCPGVAFDSQRRRLGHGKGYYDTYLASLAAARAKAGVKPPRTVALAFDEQIVEEVPTGQLDLPIDEVLTPSHHFKL